MRWRRDDEGARHRASGFVGRHLLGHLRANGDDAVGVDRECDVTDVKSVLAVLESVQPDAIYHLAALTAVGASWSNPVEYTRVNVLGRRTFLDAAHEVVPAASVVIVSSADVYGVVAPEDLPLVETFASRRPTPTPRARWQVEHVARDLVREWNQRIVIGSTVQPRGTGSVHDFLVPAIANRLLQAVADGVDEIVVGDLSTRRDFSDVRDVVRAYRLLVVHGAQ